MLARVRHHLFLKHFSSLFASYPLSSSRTFSSRCFFSDLISSVVTSSVLISFRIFSSRLFSSLQVTSHLILSCLISSQLVSSLLMFSLLAFSLLLITNHMQSNSPASDNEGICYEILLSGARQRKHMVFSLPGHRTFDHRYTTSERWSVGTRHSDRKKH